MNTKNEDDDDYVYCCADACTTELHTGDPRKLCSGCGKVFCLECCLECLGDVTIIRLKCEDHAAASYHVNSH